VSCNYCYAITTKRKACLLVNISVSVYRYRPKPDNDVALRQRLRELAAQRKRFGSPRLHILLKRENLVINHKRTERIYREEGPSLRRKRRRKGAAGVRVMMPSPQRPNQRWSTAYRVLAISKTMVAASASGQI